MKFDDDTIKTIKKITEDLNLCEEEKQTKVKNIEVAHEIHDLMNERKVDLQNRVIIFVASICSLAFSSDDISEIMELMSKCFRSNFELYLKEKLNDIGDKR